MSFHRFRFRRASALADAIDAELRTSTSQFLIPPPPQERSLREEAAVSVAAKIATLKGRKASCESTIAEATVELRDVDTMITAFESAHGILLKDAPTEAERDAPMAERRVPRLARTGS